MTAADTTDTATDATFEGSIDDYLLAYADGYTAGLRDGHAAAEHEQAARHRHAAEAVASAIKLPVITDMTGTSDDLTERAQERERAHIDRVRNSPAPEPRSLFDDVLPLTTEVPAA